MWARRITETCWQLTNSEGLHMSYLRHGHVGERLYVGVKVVDVLRRLNFGVSGMFSRQMGTQTNRKRRKRSFLDSISFQKLEFTSCQNGEAVAFKHCWLWLTVRNIFHITTQCTYACMYIWIFLQCITQFIYSTYMNLIFLKSVSLLHLVYFDDIKLIQGNFVCWSGTQDRFDFKLNNHAQQQMMTIMYGWSSTH